MLSRPGVRHQGSYARPDSIHAGQGSPLSGLARRTASPTVCPVPAAPAAGSLAERRGPSSLVFWVAPQRLALPAACASRPPLGKPQRLRRINQEIAGPKHAFFVALPKPLDPRSSRLRRNLLGGQCNEKSRFPTREEPARICTRCATPPTHPLWHAACKQYAGGQYGILPRINRGIHAASGLRGCATAPIFPAHLPRNLNSPSPTLPRLPHVHPQSLRP